MNEHALVIFGLFVPSISAELALMPYLSPIYPGHIEYWTELTEPTEVTEEEEPQQQVEETGLQAAYYQQVYFYWWTWPY